MRRLYYQRLTTSSGGNISIRVNNDIIIITPSSTDKGRMRWNEVGIITLGGENLTPEINPSIESGMHIAIYKKRMTVNSIVHAHPVFASSFTAMKCKINTYLTAEACAILGNPITVPYALMGSSELAGFVADNIVQSEILLLENHGILTAGSTILQAFDKMEVLENAAKMTLIVEMTMKESPLSKSRIMEIEKLFR